MRPAGEREHHERGPEHAPEAAPAGRIRSSPGEPGRPEHRGRLEGQRQGVRGTRPEGGGESGARGAHGERDQQDRPRRRPIEPGEGSREDQKGKQRAQRVGEEVEPAELMLEEQKEPADRRRDPAGDPERQGGSPVAPELRDPQRGEAAEEGDQKQLERRHGARISRPVSADRPEYALMPAPLRGWRRRRAERAAPPRRRRACGPAPEGGGGRRGNLPLRSPARLARCGRRCCRRPRRSRRRCRRPLRPRRGRRSASRRRARARRRCAPAA